MWNPLNKKPMQQPRQQKDNCKIKIENTSSGKTLEFSGNCSKEQLSIAKQGFIENNSEKFFEEE